MGFERFFRSVSYLAVLCGFLSLWISGTFGVLGTASFAVVIVAAWLLEGTRWQISERLGTVLIVLALPVFYIGWKYQFFTFTSSETMVAGMLARLILSLTAIKLLQRKSDRDWIFLYLMSFFQVLLAAGLSISALYLASFLLYLLVMVCAVIALEIKKARRMIDENEEIRLSESDRSGGEAAVKRSITKLPITAVALIVFIVIAALPMFFLLPRVGGAGIGGNSSGVSTYSGFSDSVRLGGIGRIQQNDEVVMRVRLEDNSDAHGGMYWRGMALDTFDNQTWSKVKPVSKQPFVKAGRDLIQVDYATGRENLSIQTFYLEPLDTPILFALSRAVAVQGNFPVLYKDTYGAISFSRASERISYKVLSDRTLPSSDRLRADARQYSEETENYLQLPLSYDARIAELAAGVTQASNNRYDKARAIESYLQNNFGYTLEQKSGGTEPLADFLFNVREGHCEYFATAMAVMLRTQGIATRVVNGFQQGEYNETADVYVVRQKNAHSWVEVYFPGENAWVPFDPTPFAGQSSGAATGIVGQFTKYLEALETFWIQYFVAYDNQEQRSLMRSVRNGFVDYQARTSSYLTAMQETIAEWWADVRGDKGFQTSLIAIGWGIGYLAAAVLAILLLVWAYRKIVKLEVWRALWDRLLGKRRASIIEFYDRMQRVLASKGFKREPHQTPLEFAFAVNMPEAVKVTEKYNRVRFGEKSLSRDEANEIEGWLERISTTEEQRHGEEIG